MSKISGGFVAESSLFPQVIYTNSEVSETQVVRVQPRDSSSSYVVTSSSNQTIRFALPRNIFGCNFSNLKFRFDFSIQGGTTPSCVNGIFSVINRLRLIAGGTTLLDEEQYGLAEWLRFNLYANSAITANSAIAFGIDSQVNRRTAAAGRQYIIYPLNFLSSNVVVPYAMMNNDIYLEFVLENPNACIESATAVTSYTIANPVLLVESVIPSEKYKSELMGMASANQLRYAFVGHNYYIQACASTNNNIRIPETCRSLKGVYHGQRLSTVTGDQTSANKRDLNYNATNLIQYKIDNTINMPPDPIQCNGVAIEQYLYSIEYFNGNAYDPYRWSPYNSPATFVSTAFIPAFAFEKQSDLNDNMLSGYDLSKSAGGIQVNIQMSSGIANNQLELFTSYDAVLTINRNGAIDWLE